MTREQAQEVLTTKVYLGDGVFAHFDGQIWLETDRGAEGGGIHRIALDDDVCGCFLNYMRTIFDAAEFLRRTAERKAS